MAFNLIDFGKVGFIQIDTGRIGGISSAWKVAEYARKTGTVYVNHTFTTQLALSASVQPFAGMKESAWCEFPVECAEPARSLTVERIAPDGNGEIVLPDAPGLGVEINHDAIKRFGREVEIRYEGETIWSGK